MVGKLELRGINMYTGATTLNGGKPLIKIIGSLHASSAVAVNYGGILASNGTVHGPVTAGAIGTSTSIAPGAPSDPSDPIGTLTINNAGNFVVGYNYQGLKQIALITPSSGTVIILK